MVDPGLTVIQDSIGSATLENTGELIKFSHANNNNNNRFCDYNLISEKDCVISKCKDYIMLPLS